MSSQTSNDHSAAWMRVPRRLGDTLAVIAPARHDEQQIAESIEITNQARLDGLQLRERDEAPLRATAHRPGGMDLRCERASSGEYELGELRQVELESIDPLLECLNLVLAEALELLQHGRRGGGELRAELEELPLNGPERFGEPALAVEGACHAQSGIELVDRAIGLDPRGRFRDTSRAQQAGRPVVAGPRVDLHGRESSTGFARFPRVAGDRPVAASSSTLPTKAQETLMPLREDLPPILRGEKHAELDADARAALESLAAESATNDQTAFVRDECAARLKQSGASPAVDYLLAAACALRGERERALQTLLGLGERLAQAKQWEPLAAVAERALELDETASGARLLVRAHEGLRKDPERVDALYRAWRILPDDLELGLLLAVRLGDSGQPSERRALLAELAPRFAAEGRYAGLEEAALEFVEHLDLESLRHVIEVIPQVAAKNALKEAKTLLDVAFPPLSAQNQAGEVEGTLRAIVRQAVEVGGPAAAEPFRGALVESIRQGTGRSLPNPDVVFAGSGLDDHLKPLIASLERFDAIAALPPGRAVLHGSFGAGRVLSDDGEIVIIDFTRSPGHRMPYAAARRSLTPLAEDDLRLLRFTQPAELERLRKDQPAEVLVRALTAIGGEADAQKLKLFLVGNGLVPAPEWTSTFRRIKAAAEKDPRIDHARAFEQHYRLAPEGAAHESEVPLPALEPRKPVKSNLATLRKFLSQHPQSESALVPRFGRYLLRVMFDEEGDRADRARAGIFVARWFPERAPEWTSVLKTLWDQGLAISELSGEEEQSTLLEASHTAGVEADAILSGLDSRFSAVRELAARRREGLDPAGREALRKTLLEHAARYPQAALRLIEQTLESGGPIPDVWRVLWAALALIEERPKPSLADKVLGWIGEGGLFEKRLAGQPLQENERLRIAVLLRQWRSSDRYLFPALDLAQRVGLAEAVAAVRAARERSARKMFEQVGQQAEVDLPVMTRATWERLRGELDRMERELRTELPKTIQKARELGDLKENAEFHSAKLKQANLTKQVEALQKRLATARFVEDAEQTDGVAGLGTEVVLESEQDVVTYWILGEDEHHHGDQVVSFQAPVGRALMGKTIGDQVALADRTYRVVSVERKLPPSAPHEEATTNG